MDNQGVGWHFGDAATWPNVAPEGLWLLWPEAQWRYYGVRSPIYMRIMPNGVNPQPVCPYAEFRGDRCPGPPSTSVGSTFRFRPVLAACLSSNCLFSASRIQQLFPLPTSRLFFLSRGFLTFLPMFKNLLVSLWIFSPFVFLFLC